MVMVLVAVGHCAAYADRLYHNDGTTIDGKIQKVTESEITIQTKYGTFTYHKADLRKVERDAPAGGTPTPMPTPVMNKAIAIPPGPVNPFEPPTVPPLFTLESVTPAAASESLLPRVGSPAPASGATTSGTAVLSGTPKPLANGVVTGQVELFHRGVSEAAAPNFSVETGDSVVARNGKARITLAGGTVKLPANSSVVFTRNAVQPTGPVMVQLVQGGVWAERGVGETAAFQVLAGEVTAQADPAHGKAVVFKCILAPSGEIRVTATAGTVSCMLKSGARISVNEGNSVSVPPAGTEFTTPKAADPADVQEWKTL